MKVESRNRIRKALGVRILQTPSLDESGKELYGGVIVGRGSLCGACLASH
jgi:hypothetical protein